MHAFLLVTALLGCNDYSLVERTPTPTPEAAPAAPPATGAPVAVCEVSPNPVTPPFQSSTFDGSQSFDPEGGSIAAYEWTLVSVPQGSTASMPPGDAVRSGFTPDLAGTYKGRLVVRNQAGVASEPCEVELQSVPAEDLWVEMFWDQEGDDMDLHLLAPNGELESSEDCYFANCKNGLEWGQQNETMDNPTLDLDDIADMGPENINILQPHVPGPFTVVVKDYGFEGSSDPVSTNVTVNVYLNGQLTWSDTRTMTDSEGAYEYFCEINWQTGTVTPL